jgi:small-conductance mechanosensitive channel
MDFGNADWLALLTHTTLPVLWIAATIVVGVLASQLFFLIVRILARRSATEFDDLLVEYGRGPGRLLAPAFLLHLIGPMLAIPPATRQLYVQVVSLAFIAGCTYLAVNATNIMAAYITGRQRLAATDNLGARRVLTQVKILRSVVLAIVGVIGFSCALMTFDGVRQVGVSILASAGLAGVVLGFAAQKSIGTLLAGVQIAITQPIRIDDVVIVEGEWGRIEEISLTFVVIRIWDQRRLIVPITQFIEKPFQNWTRSSSEILGTIFLYVDYTIEVDAVRAELTRLLQGNELWDKRVANVQVTDVKPSVLELRVLVSASDASKAWDLRCQLREALVNFIRVKHPVQLPKIRAEMSAIDGGKAFTARESGVRLDSHRGS